MPVLSADWELFEADGWYASNNVWNKGSLVNGADYTQSITYDNDRFPSDILFEWNWKAPVGPVYSYPEIVAGSKPWERTVSTIDTFPVRLDKIENIALDYTLDWAQNDNFNIAISLWLADSADGDKFSITDEIMIWVKHPLFTPAGSVVANGKDNNGSFSIWHNPEHGDVSGEHSNTWDYTAIFYDEEQNRGPLKLDALLQVLVSEGLVEPDVFVRNVEIGAEVAGGAGWFSLNDLDLSESLGRVRYGTERKDTIDGGWGRDRLSGGDKADTIHGHQRKDKLFGQAGSDRLFGDGGNDKLTGGKGDDLLVGGDGKDLFIFKGQNLGKDRIRDFEDGLDKILIKSSQADAFSDLSLQDRDGDIHVTFGDTRIILQDVDIGDVGKGDFLF